MARLTVSKAALQKVYNAMSTDNPKTCLELAQETGYSTKTVRGAIYELKKSKDIYIFDFVKVKQNVRALPRFAIGNDGDAEKGTSPKQQDYGAPFRHPLDVALFGEYRHS